MIPFTGTPGITILSIARLLVGDIQVGHCHGVGDGDTLIMVGDGMIRGTDGVIPDMDGAIPDMAGAIIHLIIPDIRYIQFILLVTGIMITEKEGQQIQLL